MVLRVVRGRFVRVAGACLVAASIVITNPVCAETLDSAVLKAYRNNPQLNAQRAALRATDEGVSLALSGYRPQVSVTATRSAQYSVTTDNTNTTTRDVTYDTNVALTANQNLFNGFQTANGVRKAEQQVRADREGLRVLEQQVLLDAVTNYMNVLRDSAILEVQRSNVLVLQQDLRQTRAWFGKGEATRTDVAQAEARLAGARASVAAAEAALASSRADYRRVIGTEPSNLQPAAPIDRLLPRRLDAAVARAVQDNPLVTSAFYGIDVALLQVKISEGALYPTVSAQVTASQDYSREQLFNTTTRTFTATAVASLTAPIYQGGAEYSLIRQAKETIGQQRSILTVQRDQARATAVQTWGQLQAAKGAIEAARTQIAAAENALRGVRVEAALGQRTTLDILNAEQEVVNARVSLVSAQHDRVVASYGMLAAIGNLTPQAFGLGASMIYDPVVHYHQVRDRWLGVRTPAGQ